MSKLSPKQKAFVEEYLKDMNATQAAVRAGYSEKTANEQGARLLVNVSIRSAIDEALAARSERTQIDADWMLKRLASIDDMDVLDILDNVGNIKPIMQWPKVWRTTISGFDLHELMTGDVETIIRKIKWPDKVKNLELIGRHIGVQAFKERVELDVSDETASRLERARKKAAQSE